MYTSTYPYIYNYYFNIQKHHLPCLINVHMFNNLMYICLWMYFVQFFSDDIHPRAKEICTNWFYKIAGIKELLPRIYIEVCV